MKILINYASAVPEYVHCRRMNTATGYAMGGFDKVIEYSPEGLLDEDFRRKNEHILKYKKGAGYWLWKPYIVRKTLEEMGEEDFLFYSDARGLFLGPIDPFIELMRKKNQDILAFIGGYVEAHFTKRDAFILMDCDTARYADSRQFKVGYHLWRKTAFSMKLVNSWLSYAQDERIITDMSNRCGKENYPGFIEHRYEQSIFSLLCKKNQLEGYDKIDSAIFQKGWAGYIHFRQADPSFIFHFRRDFWTCYYFCLRYPMKFRLNFLILREIYLMRKGSKSLSELINILIHALIAIVSWHLNPLNWAKRRIKR